MAATRIASSLLSWPTEPSGLLRTTGLDSQGWNQWVPQSTVSPGQGPRALPHALLSYNPQLLPDSRVRLVHLLCLGLPTAGHPSSMSDSSLSHDFLFTSRPAVIGLGPSTHVENPPTSLLPTAATSPTMTFWNVRHLQSHHPKFYNETC